MKLEILKAIMTDLNLAGVYDTPAESFMNAEEIDSQELIKSIFEDSTEEGINQALEESFDENSITSEMNELFAALGTGKAPSTEGIETIQVQAPKVKKVVKQDKVIIDPRNKKTTATNFEVAPVKKAAPVVADFKPQDFISTKLVDDAKIALILPYKNEKVLKTKADFSLLENILKSAEINYTQTSIIFIDDSYKKVTQGIEKEEQKLAQELENALKLIKQEIILSFGQDCLNLASPNKATIRQAAENAIDIVENKKLLANYSLSAMLNTPKYKSTTWFNILKIKQI